MAHLSSHQPSADPHLAFVNSTTSAALSTLDQVALVGAYSPTAPYPDTDLGPMLKAVAGSMANQIGTHVYWVQIEGFDTHAAQQTLSGPTPTC